MDGQRVISFHEALQVGRLDQRGFMVFEPGIVDLIEGDSTILERAPLETLVEGRQLSAYRHDGFWQCMDTVRDLTSLRELWESGAPPWKQW